MKQKNLRFHAIAIGIISLVIIVLYAAIGPKSGGPAAGGEVVGDRYITIDNATWGRNCDPYIEEAQRNWRLPAMGDKTAPTPRPQKVATDNVLSVVSALCNGKLDCKVNANSDVLQAEPLSSCYKHLTVGYRCFTYDRLTSLDITQGSDLDISCRNSK